MKIGSNSRFENKLLSNLKNSVKYIFLWGGNVCFWNKVFRIIWCENVRLFWYLWYLLYALSNQNLVVTCTPNPLDKLFGFFLSLLFSCGTSITTGTFCVEIQVQDVLEGAKVLEWLRENAHIEYIKKWGLLETSIVKLIVPVYLRSAFFILMFEIFDCYEIKKWRWNCSVPYWFCYLVKS
jgi:hypothetical protein